MNTLHCETLVTAVLGAIRNGRLAEGLDTHKRSWNWARKRWLFAVYETAGSSRQDSPTGDAKAIEWLTLWALGQLRPDRGSGIESIPTEAWINQTSWRPFLAVAAHHGFLAIPAMPSRYHRRSGESALENLCGLWAVGPSTLYRYLEKGRQQLALILSRHPLSGDQLMGLRDSITQQICQGMEWREIQTWHTNQGIFSEINKSYGAALWHLWRSGAELEVLRIAEQFPVECAGELDSTIILRHLDSTEWKAKDKFRLMMALAEIWRVRQSEQDEKNAYSEALNVANSAGDSFLLGSVFSSMGKFHESRSPDRALACYESSIQHLNSAIEETAADHCRSLSEALIQSLIRLGWLHLRRSDPRAKTVLQEAQRVILMQQSLSVLSGQLEQAWGEYWRCAGEHRKALEHKHRALNIFEQIGDQRSILTTYLNLSLIYGEMRDFSSAIEYGKIVLQSTRSSTVDAEISLATYGNMGVAYFWQGDYDSAIRCYEQTLDIAVKAGMQSHQGTTHMNLAEAYYKRYKLKGEKVDEDLGDHHALIVARMGDENNSPRLKEAARSLKLEVLGRQGVLFDQLLPEDFVAHFPLMTEVRRLRRQLAIPCSPALQANLRLDIAQAFLTMALDERNAALGLVHDHSLAAIQGRLDAMQRLWSIDDIALNQLHLSWRKQAGDWLTEAQRKAVLARLLEEGSLSKSSYGEAAEVSPATASKHLGLLADKGLLEQQGRGPATRYVLPAAASSGGATAAPPVH